MQEKARKPFFIFTFSWERIQFLVLLSLQFIVEGTIPCTTEANISSTKPPPVDLVDIGYYDGTWDQFCDRARIDRDFPVYYEHDLKNIRLLLCRLKENNLFTHDSLVAFASYKYCLVMRHRFDQLLEKFLKKLSLGDEEYRRKLLYPGRVNVSSCYNETFPEFTSHCIGNGSPCFKLFRLVLGRACFVSWLTTQDILSYIKEVCAGEFITDVIDWKAIFNTITYRE